MNIPGFTAALSIGESSGAHVGPPGGSAARSAASVEPQLGFPGQLQYVTYELDCGKSDRFGGPCFGPGPKTCRLSACHLSPTLSGGYSCQYLGDVQYPGCIRDCYQPPH